MEERSLLAHSTHHSHIYITVRPFSINISCKWWDIGKGVVINGMRWQKRGIWWHKLANKRERRRNDREKQNYEREENTHSKATYSLWTIPCPFFNGRFNAINAVGGIKLDERKSIFPRKSEGRFPNFCDWIQSILSNGMDLTWLVGSVALLSIIELDRLRRDPLSIEEDNDRILLSGIRVDETISSSSLRDTLNPLPSSPDPSIYRGRVIEREGRGEIRKKEWDRN